MSIDLHFTDNPEMGAEDIIVFPRALLELHDPEAEILKQLPHPVLMSGPTCYIGFQSCQDAADILLKASSIDSKDGQWEFSLIIMGDEEFKEKMKEACKNAQARMELAERLIWS